MLTILGAHTGTLNLTVNLTLAPAPAPKPAPAPNPNPYPWPCPGAQLVLGGAERIGWREVLGGGVTVRRITLDPNPNPSNPEPKPNS